MIESTTKIQPFVSRKAELDQLHDALKLVISHRQPKFVLIAGDFGVGKTALAEQFLTEVSSQDSTILIGRALCARATELNGLVPFGQLFASLSEQGIGQRLVLGDVTKFVKEAAPAWLSIIPGAGKAVAKTWEEAGKFLERSAFSQENVSVQFTNALRRLSETRTIIAFIDDTHWADASSLNLLFHLARNLKDRPVLFICAYRPVEAEETSANAGLFREIRSNLIRYNALEIELNQGIAVKEYVEMRYPLNMFPLDFVSHVQGITGGHALFVGQLFSLWEEKGVITSTPAPTGQPVWRLTQATTEYPTIPQVSAVLEERIRLLTDELREILTCASVEGEGFTAQVITRLRQLDELKVCDSLETLQNRYRLILGQETKRVDSTLLDLYRFAQRFFREYIYDQASALRRRILHQRIGECLEALYTADRYPIAGQLALHFSEANDQVKAAGYALMAAEFEQTRFAWSESERWCEFGLKLVEQHPAAAEMKSLRLALLERLGFAHYAAGKYPQADGRYREALTLARQLPAEPERIANLCEKIADICEYEGRLDEAIQYLDQGKQVLVDCNVPFGETQIKLESLRGFLQARLGQNELAAQSLRQVLADAEGLQQTPNLDHIKARANNRLATTLSNLGLYSQSLGPYQRAIELADKIDEKDLEAICLLNMADDCLKISEVDKSIDYASKGEKIAQQIGALDNLAYAQAIRGSALVLLARFEDAINELNQAIALSGQIGSVWNMPYMYADLAMAYLGKSNLEMAYSQAKGSVAEAEKNSDQFGMGYSLDVLAQVETARQDWASAMDHFKQAIDIHQKAGQRHFAGRTQRHLAEALLRRGETQEAVRLLQTALATFRELELTREAAETERVLNSISAQ